MKIRDWKDSTFIFEKADTRRQRVKGKEKESQVLSAPPSQHCWLLSFKTTAHSLRA